jgi:hypothetical protein
MRRDKIVARILLIFSIANAVLAAPAVVRQRHLDNAGDESADESTPSLESGSGYLPDYEASPGPDRPPLSTLSSDDSDTPSSFHSESDFDADQYYADQLSSSESHFGSKAESWHSWDGSPSATLHSAGVPASVAPQLDDDPPSASGSQQLNDPPPTSGSPPSQGHPTPESEAAHYYPMTNVEEEAKDKVKSKGICGLFCWDWHFSRSFE